MPDQKSFQIRVGRLDWTSPFPNMALKFDCSAWIFYNPDDPLSWSSQQIVHNDGIVALYDPLSNSLIRRKYFGYLHVRDEKIIWEAVYKKHRWLGQPIDEILGWFAHAFFAPEMVQPIIYIQDLERNVYCPTFWKFLISELCRTFSFRWPSTIVDNIQQLDVDLEE